MNISKKLLAVAVLAAVSSSAFAAEKGNEVSVYGSIISQSTPTSITTTIINASYGRYIQEQLAITGNITMMDAGGSAKTTLVGIGAKYYFKVGQKGELVPFVAGAFDVGTISAGGTSGSLIDIRVGGGASYFISETASFDGRLELVSGDQTFGGFSQSTSSTEFTVGITQRF